MYKNELYDVNNGNALEEKPSAKRLARAGLVGMVGDYNRDL